MSAYNYKWQYHHPDGSQGMSAGKAVRSLIIINLTIFLLINIFSQFPWLSIFGLVPKFVFSRLMVWQLMTYMFLHKGLWHFVVNMLMLWFFGPALENLWGKKQFLFYYFLTGFGAALCSFIVSADSYVPVIGASGAIFGILVAYAIAFPETVILIMFIFPMKIRQAVCVLALINLLGAISNPGGGIAYCAHLGGALFGYVYLKKEGLKRKLVNFIVDKIKQKQVKQKQIKHKNQMILNHEVDAVLDKINKQGIDSLTEEEKGTLERKGKSTE